MRLDLNYLKSITKDKLNRTKDWKSDLRLINEFSFLCTGTKDWIQSNEKIKKSTLASIIISTYRWITAENDNKRRYISDNTKRPKPINYEVREIIYAELGGTNFGVEASYEHPAIVLHNGYYFLVVIPGSTGRASRSDYIINAGTSENFAHTTGIQIDQIRVIDKSRVIKRTRKKVPEPFMKTINDKILDKYLNPIKKNIDKLTQENTQLSKENTTLTEENKKLKAEIEILKNPALQPTE